MDHPQNADFTFGPASRFKVVSTRTPDATWSSAAAHLGRPTAQAHLTLLQEGQVIKGVVRTVVEWGAFVALPEAENLEGLVHISEASHDPRAKLPELMKAGDQVEVKIIKIDDKGKIWLSRKALIEDPWAQARAKYAAGTKHMGKVDAHARLRRLHRARGGVRSLTRLGSVAHASGTRAGSERTKQVVMNHSTRNHKLRSTLRRRERADEPHQKIARTPSSRSRSSSRSSVRSLFVLSTTAGSRFVPADHTDTARGPLRKAFRIGMQLDCKIIEVDPRRGEPKLSIRAMKEDEERRAHREYRQALQREGGFGTLGDLLAKKLKQAGGDKGD
jgi:small subunit ribosomal protein S1